MPDLSQLPAPPPASPLAPTDVVLAGRPPSILGGVMTPYAVSVQALAQALAALVLPNVAVVASGTDAGGAAVLVAGAANLIGSAVAGAGVRLPAGGGNQTIPLSNVATVAVALYPPTAAPGAQTSINRVTGPQTLPAGAEVMLRTVDGVNWFAGI